MRCAPNVSRLHEQVSKGVGNATRYVVRAPLLVCVGLGIVHLRCMRDARAVCIALRSLGQALCMWLAHMFGRSMRGSHVETETGTLEARACLFVSLCLERDVKSARNQEFVFHQRAVFRRARNFPRLGGKRTYWHKHARKALGGSSRLAQGQASEQNVLARGHIRGSPRLIEIYPS